MAKGNKIEIPKQLKDMFDKMEDREEKQRDFMTDIRFGSKNHNWTQFCTFRYVYSWGYSETIQEIIFGVIRGDIRFGNKNHSYLFFDYSSIFFELNFVRFVSLRLDSGVLSICRRFFGGGVS